MNRSKPERIFLAVHRLNFTVYYRRMAPRSTVCSPPSVTGNRSDEAIRGAFEGSSASIDEQRSMLATMVRGVGRIGMAVPPGNSKKERVTQ